MTSMNKATTIKTSEITTTYLEMTGYHADEIVGAQAHEMREELVTAGYTVEELPEVKKSEPWEPTPVSEETKVLFPGFFA